MEVEPTLVDEPELRIRDPVDDGVVVALLEALVREDNSSPRSCLLVRQVLVLGTPGDGRDSHVVVRRENILRLQEGHCRRTGQDFADAPFIRWSPQGLPPPLWPVQDLAAAVVLSRADLQGEVLCRVVGDANGHCDVLQRGSALLVDLLEEATDDLLGDRCPLPLPVVWLLDWPIDGLVGKAFSGLLGELALLGREVLGRVGNAH